MTKQTKKQLAKLLSTKGNKIMKLAKDGKAKLKTAQDGELGPEDVIDIVEEVLMPAVETMAQVGEAIVEGVPGGESSIMDSLSGNGEDGITNDDDNESAIVETSTDDEGDEDEDDKESRIAKLEADNKMLMAKNEAHEKQILAKAYGDVYNYKRVAAEKEILDSTDSLETLKIKVAAAQDAQLNFKEAGWMKQSVYGSRTAKMRTASEGKSLDWSTRL